MDNAAWELVLMEDDESYAQKITMLLESSNFKVHRAHNGDEVALYPFCQDYLLDLQIGEHKVEGLMTAERVRRKIPDARIGILSARWSESYERQAKNVCVDFVISKVTPHNDVDNYLEHLLSSLVTMAKEQGRTNALKELMQTATRLFRPNKPSQSEDPNIEAFKDKISNPEWLESNKGKFAAFSDGNLVQIAESEDRLLENLKNDPPQADVFIQRIEKETAKKKLTNETVSFRKK